MMKVVLKAFNGKLESEVLDFPDGTPPEIYMTLDMYGFDWKEDFPKVLDNPPKIKGKFVRIPNDGNYKSQYEEYRLIGITD